MGSATRETPSSGNPPASTLMRAIVQDAYGSADILRLEEITRPDIAANEVLVKVYAAGLDRGTLHFLSGKPYLMRIMGFGLRRPKNLVAGIDVAGTVAEVGSNVTRFKVGDEVFGIAKGSLAEYAAALEEKLALKPASLGFEQAAVVPISGLAAIQALRDHGRIQAGQKVLVIGASGGVGTYAVQLAKAFGAAVTGVCSTAKVEFVRSLGAEHVLDYTKDDFLDGGEHYDLIIDVGGNNPLSRLRRALTRRGTLVIVGGEEGGDVTGGFGRTLRAPIKSLFVSQRLAMQVTKETAADLKPLSEFIESGQVTPVVDKIYPLAQVPDALRHLEAGSARGKIAVTI